MKQSDPYLAQLLLVMTLAWGSNTAQGTAHYHV
jgi:hypothetical protein